GERRLRSDAVRDGGGPHRPRPFGQPRLDHAALLSAIEEEMVTTSAPPTLKVEVRDLTVRYGSKTALDGVSFDVHAHEIFGIIGPANSGKTTLLKCINRTIDFVPAARITGEVRIDGEEVRQMKDVFNLRRRIGMVFPLPVGLPLSIYDNVAYAPRIAGSTRSKAELDDLVERCLRQAALW